MSATIQISLKAARVNAGYTTEEVAEKIGKSRPTINKWENGTVKIDRANLYLLSEIYKISIDNIFLPY